MILMTKAPRRRSAFTIVEVLVIVGIITLLLGLLLPALSGVRKRMLKGQEISDLRQVGVSWAMYSGSNDDTLLPGYLSVATQRAWGVKYRDRNGTIVPPAPDYDELSGNDVNVAGPWPWRLMSYLDHAESVLTGHLDQVELAAMTPEDRAVRIRESPAFGYNGLFMGGWWTSPEGYLFSHAQDYERGNRLNVVSRALGGIRRSSQTLIFASAIERTPGLYQYRPGRDDVEGTYMVQPPIIGHHELWGLPKTLAIHADQGGARATSRVGGDIFSVEFYGDGDWEDGPVPFG